LAWPCRSGKITEKGFKPKKKGGVKLAKPAGAGGSKSARKKTTSEGGAAKAPERSEPVAKASVVRRSTLALPLLAAAASFPNPKS
jgi:hypothetical protein